MLYFPKRGQLPPSSTRDRGSDPEHPPYGAFLRLTLSGRGGAQSNMYRRIRRQCIMYIPDIYSTVVTVPGSMHTTRTMGAYIIHIYLLHAPV